MKIEQGIVKYKDRDDIVCTYEKTDDGRQYYFLNLPNDGKLKNGNRIVTNNLKEAIDPDIKPNNIGIIDEAGNEVMAFENRKILPISEDILLVEKPVPLDQNVVLANERRSDGRYATELVSTAATIKNNLNAKMGADSRYVFNNQFSEATICDISGNNLINDEFYSFIGLANSKLYFSKNTVDSPITEYSILPPNVQSDVSENSDTHDIDVREAAIDKEVIDSAIEATLEEVGPNDEVPLVEKEVVETNQEALEEATPNTDSVGVTDLENNEVEVPEVNNSEIKEESNLVDDGGSQEISTDIVSDFSDTVLENTLEDANEVEQVELGGEKVVSQDVESQEVQEKVISASEEEQVQDTVVEEVVDDVPLEERKVENQSFADENVSSELDYAGDLQEESFFKDSELKADTIEVDDIENFPEEEVEKDNTGEIVNEVIGGLIKQNKEKDAKIISLETERKKFVKKTEVLTSTLRRVEVENRVLKEKNLEKDEIIATLNNKIERMKSQFVANENLLAEAQMMLRQDDYSNTQEEYLRKVA